MRGRARAAGAWVSLLALVCVSLFPSMAWASTDDPLANRWHYVGADAIEDYSHPPGNGLWVPASQTMFHFDWGRPSGVGVFLSQPYGYCSSLPPTGGATKALVWTPFTGESSETTCYAEFVMGLYETTPISPFSGGPITGIELSGDWNEWYMTLADGVTNVDAPYAVSQAVSRSVVEHGYFRVYKRVSEGVWRTRLEYFYQGRPSDKSWESSSDTEGARVNRPTAAAIHYRSGWNNPNNPPLPENEPQIFGYHSGDMIAGWTTDEHIVTQILDYGGALGDWDMVDSIPDTITPPAAPSNPATPPVDSTFTGWMNGILDQLSNLLWPLEVLRRL